MIPITFLTASLAAGAALAAVPVVLHLFMKQTPKHVIFPALRLIRERQKRSRKRLRLKNWLLLLARMALIALMAVALARPTVYSSVPLGDGEVPSALALIFDTSLSMEYRERDKSRLDEAKEQAREILKKSHESSQIFIIDSAESGAPVGLSPSAARKRVEGLTTRVVNRPLNGAVSLGYRAVTGSDRARKEVYVLTDLARSAWDQGQKVEGLDSARKTKEGVATYILRLAPKQVRDASIVEAEPASGLVTQDEQIPIKVRVRASGAKTQRVVEFRVDGVKTGEKVVQVPADGETEVVFNTPAKLAIGPHQGEVRLAGEPDPLEKDDHRYFTVDVQPPFKVLLIADAPAQDAHFVANALEPASLRPGDPRQFRVERVRTADLEAKFAASLKEYAAIFLLNVKSLTPSQWSRLNLYVREGGGLVVGLGASIDRANYNGDGAAALIPGQLGDVTPPKTEFFTFGKADIDHPLFGQLKKEVLAELVRVPITRYQHVKALEGSRALIHYQDGQPALLERIFPGERSGHVLLWTTALSRRADQTGPNAWNEFPMPAAGWAFFYLMNQTVPYMTGVAGERLNYEAGDDVTLPVETGKKFTNYTVKAPEAKTTDTLGQPVSGSLVISSAPQIGQWVVTATGPKGAKKTIGFSVNPPGRECLLTPMENKDFDEIFGKGKYSLANSPNELDHAVKEGRVGREIFAWLMVLILVLMTAENFLANRFYREKSAART
jgi:Aerotolerance regulator N-terminal